MDHFQKTTTGALCAGISINHRPHLRRIGPGDHSTCRRGKDFDGIGQNDGRVGSQSGVGDLFAANAAAARPLFRLIRWDLSGRGAMGFRRWRAGIPAPAGGQCTSIERTTVVWRPPSFVIERPAFKRAWRGPFYDKRRNLRSRRPFLS